MSLNLPEKFVELRDVDERALRDHAVQVQRNFQAIAHGASDAPPLIPITVFANAWVNFGAGQLAAGYWISGGTLFMQGFVKNGVIGATMTTLPVAPSGMVRMPVTTNAAPAPDAAGHAFVDVAGNVNVYVGSNVYVDLSSIHFRVA